MIRNICPTWETTNDATPNYFRPPAPATLFLSFSFSDVISLLTTEGIRPCVHYTSRFLSFMTSRSRYGVLTHISLFLSICLSIFCNEALRLAQEYGTRTLSKQKRASNTGLRDISRSLDIKNDNHRKTRAGKSLNARRTVDRTTYISQSRRTRLLSSTVSVSSRNRCASRRILEDEFCPSCSSRPSRSLSRRTSR